MEKDRGTVVKENVVSPLPLSPWWVVAALAASLAALLVAAAVDEALPPPRGKDAPRDVFSAERARDFLLNLTSIGPRVAGSYENDVLAVSYVVAAARGVARGASPHARLDIDVHEAAGAFPLDFLDGMNNVYRGVRSVVVRVTAAGGRARPAPLRSALLLNCHTDTVPDSPGASDDAAGCAVLLETMRALAEQPIPLAHDVIFLFNGAEENILQASHGFITQHKWAKAVRAFINIEACGVGGREMMFQAGPGDPWLAEEYAAAAPHPFASSVAQELFQSGLIPAETDFRIFRDFGGLSGLDLAWSADGCAYHTRLDEAARVPPGALQRAGDNVLAVTRALLASGRLRAPPAVAAAPLYLDVLGAATVTLRAPTAAAAAAAALLLLAVQQAVTAARARDELYVSRGAWLRAVWRSCGAVCGATLAGVGAAAGVALLLAAAGARLSFYSRPWLLAPLYALPALAAAWSTLGSVRGGAPAWARGWWRARSVQAATLAVAGGAVAACGAAGLRSGYAAAAWAAPAAAVDAAVRWRGGARAAAVSAASLPAALYSAYLSVSAVRALCPLAGRAGARPLPADAAVRWRGGARAAAVSAASLPAALYSAYLSVSAVRALCPLAGRAGARPLPADAAAAVSVAALCLLATSWMFPLVAVVRRLRTLTVSMSVVCLCACVLVCVTPLGEPYSARCPQRLMVLHARRTRHAPRAPHAPLAPPELAYWVPHLDDNTPRTLPDLAPSLAAARAVEGEPWWRLPYYLPAATLVSRWHVAPAPEPPLAALRVRLAVAALNDTLLQVDLRMEGSAHAVVVLCARAGARAVWSSAGGEPLEGRARGPGGGPCYFYTLHAAVARHELTLRVAGPGAREGARLCLAVSGHAMFGEGRASPAHADLLARAPPHVAATGWGVDLHLYNL